MSDLPLSHHKYRLAHGVYPEPMVAVVKELIAEIERTREQRDGISRAFQAWRERYSCPSCAQDRLERQLAEKDEALHYIANSRRAPDGYTWEEYADFLQSEAREALRAEPAKEEA